MNVGTLFAALSLNSAGFEKGLANSGLSFGKFNKLVVAGMAAVTLAVVGSLGAAVGSAVGFESSMTKSLAIMGDISQATRAKMEETARSVALTTTFSAEQAADSYFYLASAGLSAEQSIAALPQMAKFAQAGNFDMATATDLATDAQSALGLTSKDTAENLGGLVRVTDVLVRANTLANATVEQFSTSLTSKAGAALKAVNKDVEEGVAVLAALADQGIKGALAGQQLSGVLALLPKAAVVNSEEFERLNIRVFDSAGNMRNMADIVEDFTVALGDSSDAERVATFRKMGITKSQIDFLNAMMGSQDKIRGYEKELRSAAGFTEQVAAKQLESLEAQLTLLGNAFTDVLLTVGMKLLPVLKGMVSVIKDAIIPAVSTFFDVLGILLTPIALLIEHFEFLKPGIIAIGLAITAIMLPALLAFATGAILAGAAAALAFAPFIAAAAVAVAAVVGVSAAIDFFAMDFGDMGDRIHAIAESSKEDFTGVKDWIRDRMEETGESFEVAAAAADEHFGTMTGSAKDMAIASAATWEDYQNQIRSVPDATEGAAADTDASLDELGEEFFQLEGEVDESMEASAESVKTFAESVLATIRGMEEPVRNAGQDAISTLQEVLETEGKIQAAQAELNSDELRDALKSEDADIKKDAQDRTKALTWELLELENKQAFHGDSSAQISKQKALLSSKFMLDGLKSKDEEIKRAFQVWKEALEGSVGSMETRAAQANIGQNLASAIYSSIPAIAEAARQAAEAGRRVFPSSEPKDPKSPFRGITKGWGLGDQIAKGIKASMAGVDFASPLRSKLPDVGRFFTEPVPAGVGHARAISEGMRAEGTSPEKGGGGGRGDAFGPLFGEQNIYGMQPDEVERQTRRALRREALAWNIGSIHTQ